MQRHAGRASNKRRCAKKRKREKTEPKKLTLEEKLAQQKLVRKITKTEAAERRAALSEQRLVCDQSISQYLARTGQKEKGTTLSGSTARASALLNRQPRKGPRAHRNTAAPTSEAHKSASVQTKAKQAPQNFPRDLVHCEFCGVGVAAKNLAKHKKKVHPVTDGVHPRVTMSGMTSAQRQRELARRFGRERDHSEDVFDRCRIVQGGAWGLGKK